MFLRLLNTKNLLTLAYVKTFSKHPREIWNRGERLDHITKLILSHSLQNDPSIIDLKVSDKQNAIMEDETPVLVFSTHKKFLKDAMISLMAQ